MKSLCVSFFFSSRRRHTRLQGDWSSDVCSSDLRIAQRGDQVGDRPLVAHLAQGDRGFPTAVPILVLQEVDLDLDLVLDLLLGSRGLLDRSRGRSLGLGDGLFRARRQVLGLVRPVGHRRRRLDGLGFRLPGVFRLLCLFSHGAPSRPQPAAAAGWGGASFFLPCACAKRCARARLLRCSRFRRFRSARRAASPSTLPALAFRSATFFLSRAMSSSRRLFFLDLAMSTPNDWSLIVKRSRPDSLILSRITFNE